MEVADDNMVVIVIGDEDSENIDEGETSTINTTIQVKTEAIDESIIAPVDEILETALKHGEVINVKKESDDTDEFEYEYLDFELENDDNPEFTVTKRHKNRKKRIFAPKPDYENHEPVSYVQQLRDENPEFVKEPKKLIEHLANIMRMLRPPKLPPNFYRTEVEGEIVTFICNTCNVRNDSLGAAARHYQRFHGERYLKCYACGIDFTNTTNLYKHEKRCDEKDAKVVLQARGKYLGVKGRGRPFTTKDRFKVGPDPPPKVKGRFYCSLCTSSFSHVENLRAHEYTHAGLRPFVCSLCDAAYTSAVALKRHIQTHSEGKYICDTCGRVFKFKQLLISHFNTHLPYRKYACDSCPKRYAQKSALRHHYNTKHLNMPPEHMCPVCPKRFSRLSYVRMHLERAHQLTIITRQMFLHALPKMSESELQKIHLHQDLVDGNLNTMYITENDRTEKILTKKVKKGFYNGVSDSRKNVYRIVENGYTKTCEIPIDKENDPAMLDKFLNFVRSVKPGTEIIKVKKEVPKAQCLRSYSTRNLLPRVKRITLRE